MYANRPGPYFLEIEGCVCLAELNDAMERVL